MSTPHRTILRTISGHVVNHASDDEHLFAYEFHIETVELNEDGREVSRETHVVCNGISVDHLAERILFV